MIRWYPESAPSRFRIRSKSMRRLFVAAAALTIVFAFYAAHLSEAPTGFDNKSNGMVDDTTHQADQGKFDEVGQIAHGLGPLYNAQSCPECHPKSTSRRASQ